MLLNCVCAADANFGLYADLACAGVLLIFLIVGLVRGFINQFFGLVGSIAAFILASLLCGVVVRFLNGTFGVVDKLAEAISGKLGSAEWLTASISEENIRNACAEMSMPDFVTNFIVSQALNAAGGYENLGGFVSGALANLVVSGITYVVLYLILKLLLFLLKKLLENLVKLPGLNAANKLLGCALGLIKGLIAVYVLLFFVSIIPASEGFFANVKQAVDQSKLAAFLAEKNLFAMLISWVASKIGIA